MYFREGPHSTYSSDISNFTPFSLFLEISWEKECYFRPIWFPLLATWSLIQSSWVTCLRWSAVPAYQEVLPPRPDIVPENNTYNEKHVHKYLTLIQLSTIIFVFNLFYLAIKSLIFGKNMCVKTSGFAKDRFQIKQERVIFTHFTGIHNFWSVKFFRNYIRRIRVSKVFFTTMTTQIPLNKSEQVANYSQLQSLCGMSCWLAVTNSPKKWDENNCLLSNT